MEREQTINRAIRVLRKLLATQSKPHHRYHQSAAEEDLQRIRALKGICGRCRNVRVSIFHKNGRNMAGVFCRMRHLPIEMYIRTPLGEQPDCVDYKLRNQE